MNLRDQMASIHEDGKNSSVTIKYLYNLNMLEAI